MANLQWVRNKSGLLEAIKVVSYNCRGMYGGVKLEATMILNQIQAPIVDVLSIYQGLEMKYNNSDKCERCLSIYLYIVGSYFDRSLAFSCHPTLGFHSSL